MNKKLIVFLAIGIISFLLFQSYFNVNAIQSDDRVKVDSFIREHLLGRVSLKTIPKEYNNLTNKEVYGFLQLRLGMKLIERNQAGKAWQAWDYCLNNDHFKRFMAETYMVIATSLGERDGKTSLVLLQKALEITRSNSANNRLLEYCCLNEIIRLLVSMAEDGQLNQAFDKMAMQYSIEADRILSDTMFKYHEHDAANSIYRMATESLFWLGNDSLANQYIKKLLKQQQFYNHSELTTSYANILYGVKAYVDERLDIAKCHFRQAIDTIGHYTSYLNYDLELPYAYVGAICIDQKRYAEAIDFMEKSIKALQNEHYTSIAEPLCQEPPETMKGKNNTYNLILCYLRLQHFYKKAINAGVSSVNQLRFLELTNYTNQLIKSWFLNAADEETLLRATKLIKISNGNAIDVIAANNNKYDDADKRLFKLETEASSFYLNYLIELRRQNENSNENKDQYKNIRLLSVGLINAEANATELTSENVQKRLELLRLKSQLWESQHQELENLVFNQNILYPIDDNEMVVKYFISFTNLYISYFSAHGSGTLLLPKTKFAERLNEFKRLIKSGDDADEEQRYFYDLLVKPIEDKLQGVSRLTVLPDETLEGLTFELLKNDKGNLLINQFAVRYAYSAKKVQQEKIPLVKNFLAIAPGFEKNKTFAQQNLTNEAVRSGSFTKDENNQITLVPIRNSIDEVEEIGNLFRKKGFESTVFTSDKATKTNLENHLNDESIIHIATHGISKGEYESGLFFTLKGDDNGFLSLQELYQLNINADLVVLSACKTGVGEVKAGEGVMALPRGFICAGVNNVVASLWKVHDQKTQFLMSRFYKHLLDQKNTYSEALREAKLDCIKKGYLPLDWAGFILIGG
ncbi:MAG: CHAT domain-containing protein [Bacteroidales bacterium]